MRKVILAFTERTHVRASYILLTLLRMISLPTTDSPRRSFELFRSLIKYCVLTSTFMLSYS